MPEQSLKSNGLLNIKRQLGRPIEQIMEVIEAHKIIFILLSSAIRSFYIEATSLGNECMRD